MRLSAGGCSVGLGPGEISVSRTFAPADREVAGLLLSLAPVPSLFASLVTGQPYPPATTASAAALTAPAPSADLGSGYPAGFAVPPPPLAAAGRAEAGAPAPVPSLRAALRPLGKDMALPARARGPEQLWASVKTGRTRQALQEARQQRGELCRAQRSEARAELKAMRWDESDRQTVARRVLGSGLDTADWARRTAERRAVVSPGPVPMGVMRAAMERHQVTGLLPRHHAVRPESFNN